MFKDSRCVRWTPLLLVPDLQQSKPQNPYIMDNVFKFMGGFFSSLTQLDRFRCTRCGDRSGLGAEMFPGMTVVDNLTSLITTLGNVIRWPRGPLDPEHSHEEVDSIEGVAVDSGRAFCFHLSSQTKPMKSKSPLWPLCSALQGWAV